MTRPHVVMVTVVLCALIGLTTPIHAQTPTPEGWVVLTVDEYRELHARAVPAPLPPPASFDAALTRIDYDLHVDGDAMAGRALLTIDVFRDGWARVPLPNGLVVRDARIGNQPVPIVEGPPRSVLLPRPGRFLVTLDIVVPITASSGAESIVLPASPAPLSQAVVELPGSGVEMAVSGGFVGERPSTGEDNRWTAYGTANLPMTLSWKRKVDDRRATQPLRSRARIATLVGFGEEVALVTANVRVEVLRGLARDFTIALPAGLVVNQVNGPTVADWTVTGSTLTVRMLDPIDADAAFVIQGETKTDRDGKLAVPLIRMPSAERETGGVAVDVTGAGEITDHSLRGLEAADVAELQDVVLGRESASMMAFRLKPTAGTEARALSVNIVRYTPQAIPIANVEAARYRMLAAEDGRLLVEARYAIRNNQRSFVKVTLPPRAVVWSATVGGRTVRPGTAEANSLLLPLEKGRAGEEPPVAMVEVLYLQPIDAWTGRESARVDLPAIDLAVSVTGVALSYSPRYRVALKPGEFREEPSVQAFVEAMQGAGLRQFGEGLTSAAPMTDARFKSLLDRFNNESFRRSVISTMPVRIPFPDWGPSLLLRSELNLESRAQAIEISLKRSN